MARTERSRRLSTRQRSEPSPNEGALEQNVIMALKVDQVRPDVAAAKVERDLVFFLI